MKELRVVVTILVLVLCVTLVWHAEQISNLQRDIRELECRHVMYEDYSTIHNDGEIARACTGR